MSDDLISREETLYELATSAVYYFGIEEDKAAHDWAMGVVSKMPSAQPASEIEEFPIAVTKRHFPEVEEDD